jgi:gamma-glutamylaminecyclotransferase
MCLILHNPEGSLVDEEIIDTALLHNPDGFGIFYHDTGEVRRTMDSDKAVEWCATDRPYTAHFRYSTSGGKPSKKQCHPFKIDDRFLLMQNGTVERLRSSTAVDTAVLARVLAGIPREHWAAVLETHPCRFAICDRETGDVELFNRDLWTEFEGCLYSKPDVLEEVFYSPPKVTNKYFGSSYDEWEEEWEQGLRGNHGPVKSQPKKAPALSTVAVYGTLKSNKHNHARYLSGCYALGKGRTLDNYPLVINGLPYLLDRKGDGHRVSVEVYRVDEDTLDALDGLEGHPDWYQRKQVTVQLDTGGTVSAWVYFQPSNSNIDTGNYHAEF